MGGGGAFLGKGTGGSISRRSRGEGVLEHLSKYILCWALPLTASLLACQDKMSVPVRDLVKHTNSG